ncbi:cell division protein FtsA [Fusobacterium periodonticum]|uniref:Cell division protein FtsA n=1 Tax=Fusobacterium periodonticum 1_1_41FAA TaxID=469621 RepID=D6LIS6_9FUSO|nr:cell division protein FtsA [Fusobacterium periodonticum]EFG28302.1 cell division protein FtsA [Fusobacterium periodonticum 1_1_41FAA]
MRDDVIRKVALDIGNDTIKLLIGEMSSDFTKIAVTDYVKIKHNGLRKSDIYDVRALSEGIRTAISKIESIESPITKLSLALGGPRVGSSTVNVRVSFDKEKIIDEADMDKLLRKAKRQIFGENEDKFRILYKEVYNKKVDGPRIIKQPIGMEGKEIQADIHFVYVSEDYVRQFRDVLYGLGVDIDKIYLNSYVSAKGTLDDETRKMGVAHVDIGYGSTSVIILKNSKVLYAKTKSLGELHYISDLSLILKITREEAEEVVLRLKNKTVGPNETIKCGSRKIPLQQIKDIIAARTNDIVQFITETIDESGFNGVLARGIVLTGGTVDIEGVAEQISSKSGYFVRKMLPIPLKGIKNNFYSDATVIGIFLEDMEREYKDSIESIKVANIPIPRRDIIKDKKEDSVKEEIDDFLETIDGSRSKEKEKRKKKGIIRWLRELF